MRGNIEAGESIIVSILIFNCRAFDEQKGCCLFYCVIPHATFVVFDCLILWFVIIKT